MSMKNYKNDPVGRYLSDECIEYIEKLNEEKFNGKQFGRVLSAIIYDHDSLNKRIESMGAEMKKMRTEISGLKKEIKLKNEKKNQNSHGNLEDLDAILRLDDDENPFKI